MAHVPRSQERAVPAQAVGSSAESKAPGAKGAAVVDHEGSDIEVSPVGIALSVANSTANPDGVSSASEAENKPGTLQAQAREVVSVSAALRAMRQQFAENPDSVPWLGEVAGQDQTDARHSSWMDRQA